MANYRCKHGSLAGSGPTVQTRVRRIDLTTNAGMAFFLARSPRACADASHLKDRRFGPRRCEPTKASPRQGLSSNIKRASSARAIALRARARSHRPKICASSSPSMDKRAIIGTILNPGPRARLLRAAHGSLGRPSPSAEGLFVRWRPSNVFRAAAVAAPNRAPPRSWGQSRGTDRRDACAACNINDLAP